MRRSRSGCFRDLPQLGFEDSQLERGFIFSYLALSTFSGAAHFRAPQDFQFRYWKSPELLKMSASSLQKNRAS